MLALKQENSNVIQFEVIKSKKNQPKLKMDGTIKQTPNNNTEDRWVNPIRNKDDIEKILKYLQSKIENATRIDTLMAARRNLLIFAIGINVGLRVSDLVELQWENLFEDDMKTFKQIRPTKEQKTGKMKDICPNEFMKRYITDYLNKTGIVPQKEEYVFLRSRKGKDGKIKPIDDSTVEKMMKDIQENLLDYDVNTHSLRKTYAYHKYMMYTERNDPLALVKVQKDLNHRNSSDTARYLGITRDEAIKSSMELGEYWEL